MNLTMPYRPFRSQSRVEFIKQKFEGSFREENDAGPLKRTISTNPTTPWKGNFLQEIKDLNLDKKAVNSRNESGSKNGFANKSEGKASVKRSPAFRREKLGCTKSLTQITPHETVTLKQYKKERNIENEEEVLESEAVDVESWNDLKRSKTDTDLLKYCSGKNQNKELLPNDSEYPKNSNTLILSQDEDSECETNKKVLPQYAVVNKKKINAHKNEAVSLKFSESIRRALQSPLPKGPPPKKPPRTFCHIPPLMLRANTQTTCTRKSSISKKTDIPKLRSKLEKLEKVIKIHETGTQTIEIKNDFEKPVNVIANVEKTSVTKEATDAYQSTSQSCLPISNCLKQGTKVQNFKKLSKVKSEFYLQLDNSDLKTSETLGKNKECLLGSAASGEAIYDLPCIIKKSSFETFGKCNKNLKESVNSIKAQSLHYMCTDVINQTSTHLNPLQTPEGISKSGTLDSMQKLDEAKVKKQKASSLDILDCNDVKTTKETEQEISSETTAGRKLHVGRVSSKLISQAPFWRIQNKSSFKHLFECCLLVGLTLGESKRSIPYVKSVFPPNIKPPPLIEALCFPDASYWPPTSENHYPEEQYYSLVVTNENGERKFGYCRRVLPEGGHICLPLAYCIISPHRAGGFFNKVLQELESRHGSPGLDKFIKQLHESEFPGPGKRLKLKEILEEATRTSQDNSDEYSASTLVRRPLDIRFEEKDLTELLQHLQLSVFLKVFSSLLHERKVLLLSSSLRTLSSCAEALQSILLPFSWQHTYIPVLPADLIEMCEAPTPYVMGLLKPRNVEKSFINVNFEDGIFVDLDDSKILKCCGDEGSILPSKYSRDLKTALNLTISGTDSLSESAKSVVISDAFIRFFVQVCGNYPKFIQNLPNGEKVFQKDDFIKAATSDEVQSFLDCFTETAMFRTFIQERLQGDNEDALVRLFRCRALEYSEGSGKDPVVSLKNYKVINKKVRTLGDKIKDFTSFNK